MAHRSSLAFLLLLLSYQATGQEERVCYHVNDMYELWIVQCYGIDYSNVIQVTLILEDTKRRDAFEDIRMDVSDSVGADLPDDVFDGFKIVAVIMQRCGFTSFPFHLVTSLPRNMLRLDLNDNAISDIDFQRLNDLPYASHLVELRLYSNQIASLPADAFVNFTSLVSLELQDNLLVTLVDNTFQGLVKLQSLHLFENQIVSVSRQAFASMDSLSLLALELNGIRFLEEGTFSVQDQPNMREFPLEGNPFYCNCSLQWLKDYLTSIHYLEFSGTTCVQPRIAKFADVDFCASEQTPK